LKGKEMAQTKFSQKLIRLFQKIPLSREIISFYRYYTERNIIYKPTQFRSYGHDVIICSDVDITAPERMCIGNGVFIGPGCMISAIGGVYIGNYSGLGARCVVFSQEHRHHGAETIPFDDVRMVKPVWIEDYVWIGINVSILPGVRIGEGAIVGLGSVVSKDVEPLSIVMGNPAQVIGNRKKATFDKLKDEGKVRPPSRPTKLLWIPPLTRRKYSKELSILGFDKYNTDEIFTDPRYEA
jgi:acetyltransferase-like isoleucine patch superfamily enzyme